MWSRGVLSLTDPRILCGTDKVIMESRKYDDTHNKNFEDFGVWLDFV